MVIHMIIVRAINEFTIYCASRFVKWELFYFQIILLSHYFIIDWFYSFYESVPSWKVL
jgi:hypothetical protein